MEEMMIATTAFIRGEATAARKKKGHTSWKTQGQSKRKTSDKRSDFRGHSREGRRSNRFTRLTRTPKEILAAEAGHSTDECLQLKKQIEELVRAGKLSHLIKEIKHGRDQSKTGKKETPAKDKPTAIYMIQSWQRTRSPGIKEIQAVPSTAHGMLKFPVDEGIVTIRSTILIHVECATVITSSAVSKEAGIMREVYDHDWLSNPVMVKKHDDSWQMCVDFTDLNKTCPQVCYPLPKIDWKVESLCGYPFKCFLDAYKGYHQIQLAESDEEKMAFHTGQWVYCYTKMPFGFKNAGATYQRLVDKAFDSQIGRNIEVYIDDLVVKSHTEAKMLRDIGKTFRTLRKINMKLNPKKCMFGAVEGVFLSDFHWTSKAKQAFKQLKQHFSELPLLVAPKPKEELIVYISASYGAISAVLITENGSSVGLILTSPEGTEFTYAPRFQFTASNNEAEYEALIASLRIAVQMGVQNVHVCVDSKLVANQVQGTYVAKEENMIKYLEKIKSLVLVEILKEKSIKEKEVTNVVEKDGPTWMTPLDTTM
nr:reverse transcriptase domain-containing protein [Tanacetum cinerariifolium]